MIKDFTLNVARLFTNRSIHLCNTSNELNVTRCDWREHPHQALAWRRSRRGEKEEEWKIRDTHGVGFVNYVTREPRESAKRLTRNFSSQTINQKVLKSHLSDATSVLTLLALLENIRREPHTKSNEKWQRQRQWK